MSLKSEHTITKDMWTKIVFLNSLIIMQPYVTFGTSGISNALRLGSVAKSLEMSDFMIYQPFLHNYFNIWTATTFKCSNANNQRFCFRKIQFTQQCKDVIKIPPTSRNRKIMLFGNGITNAVRYKYIIQSVTSHLSRAAGHKSVYLKISAIAVSWFNYVILTKPSS